MAEFMRNSLRFVMAAAAVLCMSATTQAEMPEYQPVKAEHFQPRDGLGNVLEKLRKGERVNIAYLGGSITAANGWRVKTREWFQEEFPEADIHEIHAAIGGTGSDLGVFRVQRDALRHEPDLLFVEFAVNDGGASPERIWKAMEGIVRQTWAADPTTDICFVYTYRVGYETDLAMEIVLGQPVRWKCWRTTIRFHRSTLPRRWSKWNRPTSLCLRPIPPPPTV